jgi:hypothetical protein
MRESRLRELKQCFSQPTPSRVKESCRTTGPKTSSGNANVLIATFNAVDVIIFFGSKQNALNGELTEQR